MGIGPNVLFDLEDLKSRMEKDVRREYLSDFAMIDTHELTPDDLAKLRVLISAVMTRLGLSAVSFGRLVSSIVMIIGLEKILDDIEKTISEE